MLLDCPRLDLSLILKKRPDVTVRKARTALKMSTKIKLAILGLLVFVAHVAIVESASKYSDDEVKALQKFRHVVSGLLYRDYMKEDRFLIRWLRVKDLNIQEATKMLTEAIKWRKENRIDHILEETIYTGSPPPYTTDAVDNTGGPVGMFFPGRLEITRYVNGGKRQVLLRIMDQFLEFAEVGLRGFRANANSSASDITQGTIIYDFNGYSLRKHACVPCVTTYIEWIKHAEAYYPNLCKILIFINTPGVFLPLLDTMKPLMSKSTRKVLKIFGPNKEEWMKYLHSFIPLDQLRPEFGGNLED